MMKRNIDQNDLMGIGGKRNCPEKVSKVLHVRNVSSEVTERDIANLAIPFGLITYFVLTRKTGQALMEMQHEESARAMVEYYSECPPQLCNKNIVIQYSRFETLSGGGMHPEAETAVKAANEDVRKLCQEEPRLVLHVTIDNWEGPRLGHLHFYKLLHRFGNILRIIVFTQNQSPQALVEFENEISAHVAKLQLGGFNCFYGCPVRIEFSNRKCLDIKHESETGRDYTISPVMIEELNSIPNFQAGPPNPNVNFDHNRVDFQMRRPNNGPFTAAEALEMLQPLLQAASNNPNDALPILQNLAPTLSNLLSQGQQRGRSFDNNNRHPHLIPQEMSKTPVLIVANLNEERVTPDALFILFGVYGDVIRIKILYNKKDTALIQFVDGESSERAVNNLNSIFLYGKQLRVNFSKHGSISMPKPEEQNSSHLNKDYTNSRLHRFKRTSGRISHNVYPPGMVLHIAGLPDSFEESDVKKVVEDEGFQFLKIKIIAPNQRKMALVQFENVELATEALIRLHDIEAGSSKLRVSFSKGFIAN